MMNKIRVTRTALLAATLAAVLLGLPRLSIAAAQATGTAAVSPAAADAAARLNKKQFRNVKVTVDNGIATLSGTVDLYEYKADTAKRVLKAKGVTAVRNLIEVAGPAIPDSELQAKLSEKLEYDRVGYWNVFDAINVNVQNGVATLGGHALGYVARDSALALVSTYPGVKDVIDEIQVDPVSPWTTASASRNTVPSTVSHPSTSTPSIPPRPSASPCRTATSSLTASSTRRPTRIPPPSAPTPSPASSA